MRALGLARRRPFAVFVIVLTLVFAATLATLVLVGAWPGNVVFGSGTAETRMVVDSAGAFHVLVRNTTLVYATNAGGRWATSVPNPGYIYYSGSIARDPQDHIHLVGEGFPHGPYPQLGEIRYLTNVGGAWSATTIAAEGAAPSIAVDSSGIVRIAYLWSNETTAGNRTTEFHLVTGTGGSWNDTVVYRLAGDATADSETDIATTRSGTVAISFVGALYWVAVLTNRGGPWTFTWLTDTAGSGGLYGPAPVGIDSSGDIHVLLSGYNVTTNSTSVIHAEEAGGIWTRDTVAETGGAIACSMILDAADHVHLDYIDGGSGTLYYVTNSRGSWTREVVDPQAGLFAGTSVGMLPSGGVAVVYEALRSPPLGESIPQSFVRVAGSNVAGWNAWDFFVSAAPLLAAEFIIVAVAVRLIARPRGVPPQ